MNEPRLLARLATIFPLLLFAFPAFSLSTPIGAGLVQAALLIVALIGLGSYHDAWQIDLHERPQLKLFIKLWLLAIGLELLILALHGAKGSDVHSPALRLACLGTLLLMVRSKPQTALFWYGIIIGCISVFLIGLYQRYVLNLPRATGFHNQIHYGNFSLAMGLMAMVAMTQAEALHNRLKWALGIAAICGVCTSLLSGSRGGWISLFLAGIPIYALSKNKHRALMFGLGILTLLTVVALIPATGIQARLLAVITDLNAYRAGDVHTSIGIRLELFRASWIVFLQHPWIGIGRDFTPVLNELRNTGIVIPAHYQLNDTHNEVLFAMVRGGLIGLAQVFILLGAPFIYFASMLREPSHRSNRKLIGFCGAGLILVMATIEFGLSVNVFTRHIGKAFYFVTISFLIAAAEISARRTK